MHTQNFGFKRLPLRGKLMLLFLLMAFVILLVVNGAFIAIQYQNADHETERKLNVIGNILASQGQAAITFENKVVAEKLLQEILKSDPYITAAYIYDDAHTLFATYPKSNQAGLTQKGHREHVDKLLSRTLISHYFVTHNDERYFGGEAHLLKPVIIDSEFSGTIHLVDNRGYFRKQIEEIIVFNIFIILITMLIAFGLALWLPNAIVSSVLELTQLMAQVSSDGDYSVRAKKHHNDELGQLVDGFNVMLAEVAKRDRKLGQYNAHLGVEIARRTAELRLKVSQLEGAKEIAEQANRAKSRFLANMSHELRTPLNAIIGYSEILQEDLEDEGLLAYSPDLHKIHAAAAHLLGIISDVLDITKIEAGQIEVFLENRDMNSLVKDILHTAEPLFAKRNNSLKVNMSANLGQMTTDSTKLTQIVLNLLGNAAKFTQNGTVTLDIQRKQDARKAWMQFIVTDNGVGMTTEQQSKVFDAFTQADDSTTREYGGIGLGLAISKKFAQLLGGSLSLNSTLGEGSCFTLILPLHNDVARQSPALPAERLTESGLESPGAFKDSSSVAHTALILKNAA
jgi:signal transduction histidine kinase